MIIPNQEELLNSAIFKKVERQNWGEAEDLFFKLFNIPYNHDFYKSGGRKTTSKSRHQGKSPLVPGFFLVPNDKASAAWECVSSTGFPKALLRLL